MRFRGAGTANPVSQFQERLHVGHFGASVDDDGRCTRISSQVAAGAIGVGRTSARKRVEIGVEIVLGGIAGIGGEGGGGNCKENQ